MRPPNRFLQYMLKLALACCFVGVSAMSLAQNEPANAEVSASSSASSTSTEKSLYANNTERDNALLVKAFTAIAKADELQWLEAPDEKVLSLYKTGETRKTKGVLLIMHSPEIPQLWPANLENLRRNLPLYGWATMALPLPTKYPTSIPEREPAAVNSITNESTNIETSTSTSPASSSAASSESAKPAVARNKLIAGRVEAAITQLNTLGQLDLAILVDNSSAPDALAALYKKFNVTTNTPLKALILVNLQEQEPLSREQLGAIFAVGNLPVMDVFFNPDNKAQSDLRRLHRAEAMRQNLKSYQQLILPTQSAVTISDTQSFWLGKTHGFLTKEAETNKRAQNDTTATKNLEVK